MYKKKFLMERTKQKCRNRHNLYLGAETAFQGASKFKNAFLLLQLVFEVKPPIGISVFWLGSPYHVTDCPRNLHKHFSICIQSKF